MDQNNHNNNNGVSEDYSQPSPPPPIPVILQSANSEKKQRISLASMVFKYFFILLLISSLVLNFYLGFIVSRGLLEQVYRPGQKHEKIALISLKGSIDLDLADEMRRMLRRAEKDKSVKGVILVVNSPGGQVAPSDMINKYISNYKEETNKMVYVSIMQVGASGAYWAAAATDKIFAQTNSAVGSIGVIYINLVAEKALKEKLGIEPIVIKSSRSPYKDKGSFFRIPTEEEKKDIIEDIDKVHLRFVQVVSDGRNISIEETWNLASGDVFDGPEALENNLIDQIGFLDDAIDDLAKTLNIKDPMVIKYSEPPTFKEMLSAGAKSFENPLDIRSQLEKWAASPRILALWTGN